MVGLRGGPGAPVRKDPAKRALEAMVRRFAFWSSGGFAHGGDPALVEAFAALGWQNPYPAPDEHCCWEGCENRGTILVPGPAGPDMYCQGHIDHVDPWGNRRRAARG